MQRQSDDNDPSYKDPEADSRDSEHEQPESQESKHEHPESQDSEHEHPESQDSEHEHPESQDSESQDSEHERTKSQDSEHEQKERKSRKRKIDVDPALWAKKQKKRDVNFGRTRVFRGESRERKVTGTCGVKCKRKCTENISANQQININKEFWGLGNRGQMAVCAAPDHFN